MICIVRNRSKVYKRLRLDNWGELGMYGRLKKHKKFWKEIIYWCNIKKLFRDYRYFKRARYVYKLWGRKRFNLPKRIKKNYLVPRLLRNFYITIKEKNFRKFINGRLNGQGFGFFRVYIMRLEGRLLNVLYRSNWINNLFSIKSFVDLSVVSVNFKKISYVNYSVNVGDIIQIHPGWSQIIQEDLILRMSRRVNILPRVFGLFVSYTFMYCFFFRVPLMSDFVFPVTLDLGRALDFVGPLR